MLLRPPRSTRTDPLFPYTTRCRSIVTAGNASGVNDGAAALIVGTRAAGENAGAAPLVRIVTTAVAGVEPRVMGLGPVPAANKVLRSEERRVGKEGVSKCITRSSPYT